MAKFRCDHNERNKMYSLIKLNAVAPSKLYVIKVGNFKNFFGCDSLYRY